MGNKSEDILTFRSKLVEKYNVTQLSVSVYKAY